jgi:hypothetical protein
MMRERSVDDEEYSGPSLSWHACLCNVCMVDRIDRVSRLDFFVRKKITGRETPKPVRTECLLLD